MIHIFDKETIDSNQLYGALMTEINDLYAEHGCPAELEDSRTTTTGNRIDDEWCAGVIGDWGGCEEYVASWAQGKLDEVLDTLSLSGVSYYYSTVEWREFTDAAQELIDAFDTTHLYGFDPMSDMGLRDELISDLIPSGFQFYFESGKYDKSLLEIKKASEALGTQKLISLYVDHVLEAVAHEVEDGEICLCQEFYGSLINALENATNEM